MQEYVSKTVGNGVTTSYMIGHCLGTEDVDVSAYDQHGQLTLINTEVRNKDVVQVDFLFAPKPGEYTVHVIRN